MIDELDDMLHGIPLLAMEKTCIIILLASTMLRDECTNGCGLRSAVRMKLLCTEKNRGEVSR